MKLFLLFGTLLIAALAELASGDTWYRRACKPIPSLARYGGRPCTREWNPVCGMTCKTGRCLKKTFGNCCTLLAANDVGGKYQQCDNRAEGYVQETPYC